MQLILDVVKSGKNTPAQKSFRFEGEGGVIGRSVESDYQLTDPQNYISSKHAYIEKRHEKYFIRDESTNGTFIKHPYKKLIKGTALQINASDIYIIGDHELQARFRNNDYTDDFIIGAHPGESESLEAIEAIIPNDDFLNEDESSSFGKLDTQEPAQQEDILDVLGGSDEMVSLLIPDDASIDEPVPQAKQDLFEEHIEVPSYTAARAQVHTRVHNDDDTLANSLVILEKKLGIDIVSLEKEQRDALMSELADVIVNSLDGLRNSLHIKEKTTQDLRIPSLHTDMQESNPVKLGKSASQLLQNEHMGGRLGMMKLSSAVTKSFAEIDSHSIALHGASKNLMNVAALGFAPKNLEHKFESMGALRGPMPRPCLLWKAYAQMFDRLNESPESGIEMIAPHFTKEYEKVAFSVGLASLDATTKR